MRKLAESRPKDDFEVGRVSIRIGTEGRMQTPSSPDANIHLNTRDETFPSLCVNQDQIEIKQNLFRRICRQVYQRRDNIFKSFWSESCNRHAITPRTFDSTRANPWDEEPLSHASLRLSR